MVTLLDKADLGDIKTQENIRLLVDSFYGNARQDELLGPIFDNTITNWDHHLPTMYKFWNVSCLSRAIIKAIHLIST